MSRLLFDNGSLGSLELEGVFRKFTTNDLFANFDVLFALYLRFDLLLSLNSGSCSTNLAVLVLFISNLGLVIASLGWKDM